MQKKISFRFGIWLVWFYEQEESVSNDTAVTRLQISSGTRDTIEGRR